MALQQRLTCTLNPPASPTSPAVVGVGYVCVVGRRKGPDLGGGTAAAAGGEGLGVV